MPMLGQVENVFHCDVLIDNVLLIDFYFNCICVGLAKNFPPFGRKQREKRKIYSFFLSGNSSDYLFQAHE